ncbi:MAG: hypothetical protein WCD79_12700, partial [Chthoniobacteraceae bacterium]
MQSNSRPQTQGGAVTFFYGLLARYLSLYIRPGDSMVEVNPPSDRLRPYFEKYEPLFLDGNPPAAGSAGQPQRDGCGYYVLNSCIHYEADIQTLFDKLRRVVPDSGRVVILYYSALW